MERTIPLKFKNADGTFIVLPDDACQLVGYDYDGNEIYKAERGKSGDKIRITQTTEGETNG